MGKLCRERPRPGARGFTLVEVMVVLVVLVIALGGLVASVVSSMRLSDVNEETAVAKEAVRQAAERVGGAPFREIFATFNDDPADDPGPGPAPGADFPVPGLNVRPGDPDGMVGRILFPEIGGVIREDFVDESLGMPRDLNADGDVDGADHTGDYVVLPVKVRLEWTGTSGERRLELDVVLFE